MKSPTKPATWQSVIGCLEFQDAFSPSESAPPLPKAKAALLVLEDDPFEDGPVGCTDI